MASGLTDAARALFLSPTGTLGTTSNANISWTADNIKAMLGTGSVPSLTTTDFFDDISAASNGVSANLGSKTGAAGVADAADITITATGATQVTFVALYKDTGTASTSPVIAIIDSNKMSGLPFTPAASQVVTITWDNTAGLLIFKL